MGGQTTYGKKKAVLKNHKSIVLRDTVLESKILNKMETEAIFVGTTKWRISLILNCFNDDNLSYWVI